MLRTFNVHASNYYDDRTFYTSDKLVLEENMVYCLVGCNGIGKSTLVNQMINDNENCLSKTAWDMCQNYQWGDFRDLFNKENKQENYNEFYFSADRHTRLGKSADNYFEHELFGSFQSTGERNVYDFYPIIDTIKKTCKNLTNKKYYIFLDDLDVGTSIDILQEYVLCIKALEAELRKNNIIYNIIVTANAYELAKNFVCIDCTTLQEIRFSSYEEYADYIIKTRKFKDNRDGVKESK